MYLFLSQTKRKYSASGTMAKTEAPERGHCPYQKKNLIIKCYLDSILCLNVDDLDLLIY